MTACRKLAASRGVDERTCKEIDTLHLIIEDYILLAIKNSLLDDTVHTCLKELDFMLQQLWDFPEDEKFHTLYKKYLFKKHWVGRKYRCNKTGEEFTIPFDIYERDFFHVGEGFIDLGRLNCYSRFGGVTEVKEE